MIQVEQLTKRYGEHLAVDGVSFGAKPGEILGLLGPNGAGKSTIMRTIAGYLAASGGHATVAGFDVGAQSLEVRRRLGYLPEHAGLYTDMRVVEYLAYRAALKGTPTTQVPFDVARALRACGIADVRQRIIGQLSKGYRQRVSLAAALLRDPPALMLDEPTSGLDPVQQRDIQDLVREIGRKRTVLFSTHVLSEAEAVCDRVVIIDHGRIQAEGTPRELAARAQPRGLHVEVKGNAEPIVAALQAVSSAPLRVIASTPTVKVTLAAPDAASLELRERVSRAIVAAGGIVLEMTVESGGFDAFFARLFKGAEA